MLNNICSWIYESSKNEFVFYSSIWLVFKRPNLLCNSFPWLHVCSPEECISAIVIHFWRCGCGSGHGLYIQVPPVASAHSPSHFSSSSASCRTNIEPLVNQWCALVSWLAPSRRGSSLVWGLLSFVPTFENTLIIVCVTLLHSADTGARNPSASWHHYWPISD